MFFRNEMSFLSNMYKAPFWIDGLYFSCSEAAFQAYKCADRGLRKNFRGLTGPEAKRLGRTVKLREDWEAVKLDVMYKVVKAKFDEHPELMTKLRAVEGKIVEENTWGDTFWGCCRGTGKNHLGKILMRIRDEQNEAPFDTSTRKEFIPCSYTVNLAPKAQMPTAEELQNVTF